MGVCRKLVIVLLVAFGLASILCGVILPGVLRDGVKTYWEDRAVVTKEDVEEMNKMEEEDYELEFKLFHYSNAAAAGATAGTNLAPVLKEYKLKKTEVEMFNATISSDELTYTKAKKWAYHKKASDQNTDLMTDLVTFPNLQYMIAMETGRAMLFPGYLNALRDASINASLPVETIATSTLMGDPRITLTADEAAAFCALFPLAADDLHPENLTAAINVTTIISSHTNNVDLSAIPVYQQAGFTNAARQQALYTVMNEWSAQALAVSGLLSAPFDGPFVTLPAYTTIMANGLEDPNQTSIEAVTTKDTVLYTCKDDLEKCGTMYSYDGMTKFTGYGHDEPIDGSHAGTRFTPDQVDEPMETFSVFSHEIMANIQFEKDAGMPTDTVKGIKVNRYIPDNTLLRADANFVAGTRPGTYKNPYADGLLNYGATLTGDLLNAPLWVSKQYYLGADESLKDGVDGIPTATAAEHEIYLSVEPISGIIMDGHLRTQLNVRVEQGWLKGTSYENLMSAEQDAIYLPLVHTDTTGTISDEQADDFKRVIYGVLALADIIMPIGVSVGIVFLLISFCVFRRGRAAAKKLNVVPATPAGP